MAVVVLTPPAPLVSLELARAQARVEDDDSDTLLQLFIDAASAEIDGPGGWLERAIGPQELELRLESFSADDWRIGPVYAWDGCWTGSAWSRWPFAIRLPCPPLIEIVSITYEGLDGADVVLGPSGWQVDDAGVEPAFGAAWPGGRVAANAVRIRYRAGYAAEDGTTPAIPADIQAAVLLRVADLYANREAQIIEAGKGSATTNATVEALLAKYRVWRV